MANLRARYVVEAITDHAIDEDVSRCNHRRKLGASSYWVYRATSSSRSSGKDLRRSRTARWSPRRTLRAFPRELTNQVLPTNELHTGDLHHS